MAEMLRMLRSTINTAHFYYQKKWWFRSKQAGVLLAKPRIADDIMYIVQFFDYWARQYKRVEVTLATTPVNAV